MILSCGNTSMKSEFLFGHIVYIELDTFTIVGLDDNSQETITISTKHKVNAEYLKYHKEQYLKHN